MLRLDWALPHWAPHCHLVVMRSPGPSWRASPRLHLFRRDGNDSGDGRQRGQWSLWAALLPPSGKIGMRKKGPISCLQLLRPAGILFLISTVLVDSLERLLSPFLFPPASCSPAHRWKGGWELLQRWWTEDPLSFLTVLCSIKSLSSVVSGWILEALLAVRLMRLTFPGSSLAQTSSKGLVSVLAILYL